MTCNLLSYNGLHCVSERTRTPNPQSRNLIFYPVELRRRLAKVVYLCISKGDILDQSHVENMMRRCIELALNGWQTTSPNPMVGCVICKDNEIISEGYHFAPGQPHAEVQAIKFLSKEINTKECDVYVNLEPCSHYGRTPPCANLIIDSGFSRVFIGSQDPNPLVSGSGIKKIKEAGIEVYKNVLNEECKELNRVFFKNQTHQLPYIILKYAISADGFIYSKDQKWISDGISGIMTHRLRSKVDGILIGSGTVKIDEPSLTTRNYPGTSPIRIIIDRSSKLKNLGTLSSNNNFIYVSNKRNNKIFNGKFLEVVLDESLLSIFKKLYKMGISNILIEGGAGIINSTLTKGLWDETHIFRSSDVLNQGLSCLTPQSSLLYREITLERDLLQLYRNKKSSD